MDILGKAINKQKIEIFVDNKKDELKDIFVFFKGRIFNKEEIVKKYKIENEDEKVIIKELYSQYGLDFLNDLDGNFGIVIYDEKQDKTFLIKDKLGSTPLYYYYNNEVFLFSTSLKEITKCEGFKKEIDTQSLSNYLGYMFIYEPYTIFVDTYKVEKGSVIEFSKGNITKKKYYSLADVCNNTKEDKCKTEDQQAEELQLMFEKSIEKLGDKDSQVAVFMSSGKDSTLLAKLASNYYTKKINTYTIGFYDERNEAENAEKIANYIGTNHHTIMLPNEEVIGIIEKSAKIYEEPFADPSIIPNIYLTENIKDKNDIYITGEGNDAIFALSNIYDVLTFKGFWRVFKENIRKKRKGLRYAKNKDELLQMNVIRKFVYTDKIVDKKGKIYSSDNVKNPVRRTVIGYLNNIVSEKYREKTGALARYHNYNYFTPFYDVDIIEKTFSIPLKMILKEGKGKYIFEKVLYNNMNKELYSNYKKTGFGIPIKKWMKEYMIDEIKKITQKEFIEEQGLFNYDELIKLLNKCNDEVVYSMAIILWNYYIFQLWYKENMM